MPAAWFHSLVDTPERHGRQLITSAAAASAVLWLLSALDPMTLLVGAAFVLAIALDAQVEAAPSRDCRTASQSRMLRADGLTNVAE